MALRPAHLLPLALTTLAIVVTMQPVGASSGNPPPIRIGEPSSGPSQPPITIGPKPAANGPAVPAGFNTTAALDAGLKIPLDAKTYTWTAGQTEPVLPSAKSFLCVLTGITGNLAGGGEHLILGVEANKPNPNWTIMGTSGQSELAATVTCVNKNRFTPGMLNPDTIQQAPGPYKLATSCNVERMTTGYAGLTYALFIRELAGAWRGGGEQVRIVNSDMMVGGCSGNVGASIVAFRFVSGGPVKFLSPFGRAPLNKNSTMSMMIDQPNNIGGTSDLFSASANSRSLVPYDKALCGFVSLSGRLQGYGESVALAPRMVSGVMMWTLEMKSAANPTFLSASVRCIARDQRAV